jgi:hypothetical protein
MNGHTWFIDEIRRIAASLSSGYCAGTRKSARLHFRQKQTNFRIGLFMDYALN